MRILMVAPQPFFRPRGTPFSVLHRIRALIELGHTVDLVTYPFGESPDLPGLRIFRSRRPRIVRDVPIGPSFAKLLLDGPLFRTASALAAHSAYDLLHTHEEAGMLGARLARTAALPHLYDMHSSLPQQFANFGKFNWSPVVWAFRRLERYTLDGADGVIAICPELGAYLGTLGYGGPVAVIENTLDFDPPAVCDADIRALRDRLGLGDGPAVVYTGTLEAYQGLGMLVAAAPAVLERMPDARFVLVGGTTDQIAQLREECRAADVAHGFVFVPAVAPTEVFQYLRMADVLVTTRSKGTNTPLKIYQYLRAGRPIVATAIRSHTQVLDDTTAALVPPTADGVADGILSVLADPPRARRLADAAALVAVKRYGKDRYLETLAAVLAQVRDAAARRSAT
jgi:glycosyltransferase involved in cell wall biosynthesis